MSNGLLKSNIICEHHIEKQYNSEEFKSMTNKGARSTGNLV